MMNEQDFSKIFLDNKHEFSDDGFSERVVSRLPKRKSMLPQIIMVAFVAIGLVLMFALRAFSLILEQINSLVASISQLQIPSASAIITYFGLLGLIGLTGYAIAHSDAG